MTSVAQLPVEASSAKGLPQGETPRTRANKPSEEGGEGGFAVALTQALPERQRAAKAEQVVELKSFGVEGEGIPAEEVKASADALKGEVVRPAEAVTAQTGTLVAQAAPVATQPEQGGELVAVTETSEEGPVAERAEESGEADVVAPRHEPTKSRENTASVRQLALAETMARESRTPERPLTVHTAPVEQASPPKTAHVPVEQAPSESSTRPQKMEGSPAPRNETAAELRRIVESPVAAKTEAPRADETPVIEFRVRQESHTPDVRRQPEAAGWERTLGGKAAVQSEAAAVQLNTASRQSPAAPNVEAAPLRAEPDNQSRLQPAEHRDLSRPSTPSVAAAPQGGRQEDDAQAGRENLHDARDESVERKATGSRATTTSLAADSQAQTSEPVALKPAAAVTPAVQPSNAPQMAAPANTIPVQTPVTRAPEATRPVAAASLPSEPEIAAQLQQQSGRTTLNVVLQDERLGRVALQLVERGGWIETAIRASDPRTAQALSNGAAGLLEALQQRGLTAAGSGASAWDAREGERRDNPQRDQESHRRRFRLRRSSGEFEGALARAEV